MNASIVYPLLLLATLMALTLWWFKCRKCAGQSECPEHHYREVIENLQDVYYRTDTNGIVQDISTSVIRTFGHAPESVIGKEIGESLHISRSPVETFARLEDNADKPFHYDTRGLDRDGEQLYLSVNCQRILVDGKLTGFEGTIRDTSKSMRNAENLQLAASVFTHAREGICITDPDGIIVDVNDAFARITGYPRQEAVGKPASILKSGRHDQAFYADMWRQLTEEGSWSGEIWNKRKNGEIFPLILTISAITDDNGKLHHYSALYTEISAQKDYQLRLERMVHYDPLTNLPNRELLADRLKQAMVQEVRRGQRLAVLFLDLDGFKAVNDRHGHDVGDQLLITLAERMRHVLREGDTIGRIGGDEFVAVLIDIPTIEDSMQLLERLLQAASGPLEVDNLVLRVSASIGVTFYPQGEEVDPDQLLRQADQAMYQAKVSGKNRYHIFDAELDRNTRGHHESLEAIRAALEKKEFLLYYQPKVNMGTGRIIGAEALVRWNHPERGILSPIVFLPIIDSHPLGLKLGEWVIERALIQMQEWRSQGLDLPVSVNISGHQLQQGDFIERLRALLQAHPDVHPDNLELEVVESSALEDIHHISEVIHKCNELGVTFALDDFGTGYSSLTYLKRLPANRLKIDQTFVRDMLDDPYDLAILEGVMGMVRSFRLQPIAEGVETREHGEMLLQLDCQLGQGYGIARPMPAEQLPAWIGNWKPYPEWAEQRPIRHDDLPLVLASADHRAWIRGIRDYVHNERELPPALDNHKCRFGIWIDNEGVRRYGGSPTFLAIIPLHEEIHALAVEMYDIHGEAGTEEQMEQMLARLYRQRDKLLAMLKELIRESQRQN